MMPKQFMGQQNGYGGNVYNMWQGGAKNLCNDVNGNVISYNNSLYPTHNSNQNPTPAPFLHHNRFGLAASALLKKVTVSEKNHLAWAILDSGASSHFIMSQAPVCDKAIATSPMRIRLPNGETIQSSHVAILDLPQLPAPARIAHIVPGLASHSLISVVKLCKRCIMCD